MSSTTDRRVRVDPSDYALERRCALHSTPTPMPTPCLTTRHYPHRVHRTCAFLLEARFIVDALSSCFSWIVWTARLPWRSSVEWKSYNNFIFIFISFKNLIRSDRRRDNTSIAQQIRFPLVHYFVRFTLSVTNDGTTIYRQYSCIQRSCRKRVITDRRSSHVPSSWADKEITVNGVRSIRERLSADLYRGSMKLRLVDRFFCLFFFCRIINK